MIRVVIDTSVLVSAVRSRQGASHRLLSGIPDPRFRPVISPALFLEYQAVLGGPENLAGRPRELAERFLDYLLSVSLLQETYYLWRPFLRDPDDDLVLETGVAAQASCVITFNLRDFQGSEQFGIVALTPSAFLQTLTSLP